MYVYTVYGTRKLELSQFSDSTYSTGCCTNRDTAKHLSFEPQSQIIAAPAAVTSFSKLSF